MRHPFQRLIAKTCPEKLLLAAAGPNLYAYNLANGALASSWIRTTEAHAPVKAHVGKKRRLSVGAEEATHRDNEDREQDDASNAGAQSADTSSITRLAITRDGGHVVAATDSDKSVRVFAFGQGRQLEQFSERPMPKRPCALAISGDNSHVICGDKFGDVYAFPLLKRPGQPTSRSPTPERNPAGQSMGGDSNNRTGDSGSSIPIHTARNKRAREQQLRDTAQSTKTGPVVAPDAQLLLGHVSMLTDLVLAPADAPAPAPALAPSANPSASASPSPDPSAKPLREHIITCDRDEHIRVSRGIPQTHVIERYCLGHTEFVSRLFVPPGRPELLLSGGGDDYIYVWNWRTGALRHRLDLRHILNACWNSSPRSASLGREDGIDPAPPAAGTGADTPDDIKLDTDHATSITKPSAVDPTTAAEDEEFSVAVSGIWGFDCGDGGIAGHAKRPAIVVACEGVPALFTFHLSADDSLTVDETVLLKGNALDVALYPEDATVVVSIDNVHQPWSTTDIREPQAQTPDLVQCFTWSHGDAGASWRENSSFGHIGDINRHGSFEMLQSACRQLSNVLYNIENLRKQGGYEQ